MITPEELAAASDADITATITALYEAQAARQRAAASTAAQLAADNAAELPVIEKVIADLATLTGDAATAGSIRRILGTTADAPGTSTLRALRAIPAEDVLTGDNVRALIGHVIALGQRQLDEARALRRVARVVMRSTMTEAGALGYSVGAAESAG